MKGFTFFKYSISVIVIMIVFKSYGSDPSLAEQAQNPISDLISLPLQNNLNFNYGPLNKKQNVLNIQPVIPFSISKNWNVVTRTILPVISQPPFLPQASRKNGVGNTSLTVFFVPKKVKKIIWGVGPMLQIPTVSNKKLGVRQWALGPSVVLLQIKKAWVYGMLINNIFSLDGDDKLNQLLIQPFINYNFSSGWYLSTSPIITADWEQPKKERWTVPLGGGLGKVFKISTQAMNASLQLFYNVISPDRIDSSWAVRFQLQFLFPA